MNEQWNKHKTLRLALVLFGMLQFIIAKFLFPPFPIADDVMMFASKLLLSLACLVLGAIVLIESIFLNRALKRGALPLKYALISFPVLMTLLILSGVFLNPSALDVSPFRKIGQAAFQLILWTYVILKIVQYIDKLVIASTIDSTDSESNGKLTDLMRAAAEGDLVKASSLIANKCDVNEVTSEGFTALMFAARNNHIEIIKLLLSANAKTSLATHTGKTAMTIARKHGFLYAERILIDSTLSN